MILVLLLDNFFSSQDRPRAGFEMLGWVLLSLVGTCAAISLRPSVFFRLPDKSGNYRFNNGAASASVFDPVMKFLYVIGTRGDVLNVVDLSNPDEPRIVKSRNFNDITEGYPDAIASCRTSTRAYLAIGFEKLGTASKGTVKFFNLLESYSDTLDTILDTVTLDGYDPTALKWTRDCTTLIAVSQGRIHKINGDFEDPPGSIEILRPSFGSNVDRTNVPITESSLAAAGVRHVFTRCQSGSSEHSTRVQDLEPTSLTIDDDDVAYIGFTKNNALAALDLRQASVALKFLPLATKPWYGLRIDGSPVDGPAASPSIRLQNYPIETFYQPSDILAIKANNRTYIVSADGGDITSYGVDDGCIFDESLSGKEWINDPDRAFGAALSAEQRTNLRQAMNDDAKLGTFRFTRLYTPADGYNVITEGYDRVTGYGGRSVTIFNPATRAPVFDSGDLFEQVFEDLPETSPYRPIFNADVGSFDEPQSSREDITSSSTGPRPKAVEYGEVDGQKVVIVANGHVGGLYYFLLNTDGIDPVLLYQNFIRRGQPGISWNEAYSQGGDLVGEPDTRDIQWIHLEGRSIVAVLSNMAGAISFYDVIS